MAVMNLISRENFMMAASLAMPPYVYVSGNIEIILKHRSVSESFFSIFINFSKQKRILKLNATRKFLNHFILMYTPYTVLLVMIQLKFHFSNVLPLTTCSPF